MWWLSALYLAQVRSSGGSLHLITSLPLVFQRVLRKWKNLNRQENVYQHDPFNALYGSIGKLWRNQIIVYSVVERVGFMFFLLALPSRRQDSRLGIQSLALSEFLKSNDITTKIKERVARSPKDCGRELKPELGRIDRFALCWINIGHVSRAHVHDWLPQKEEISDGVHLVFQQRAALQIGHDDNDGSQKPKMRADPLRRTLFGNSILSIPPKHKCHNIRNDAR
jgi:hypothetical protein